MKSQFVILGATSVMSLATSGVASVLALGPSNITITPDNSTLFLENGGNISGIPSLMPSENITTSDLTDANVTVDKTIRLPDLLKIDSSMTADYFRLSTDIQIF
jgi:hypothetical protein